MSNVVLSDELLKLYFGFARSGKVTNDESSNNITKITRLLACIKEFYTNREQLQRCGITEEMITAVESMPLFNLNNTTIELKDLVLKSKLKLLLVDRNCRETDVINYNILAMNPRYGFHYSMTFKSGENKSFAVNHIKRLIDNAVKVEIIDPYFDNDQFTENLMLLNQFINNKMNKLEIMCGNSNGSINLKTRLTNAGYTNTKCPQMPPNTHDRYIKANGVKIHLSAGFYALTQQNKELTYMVEVCV
jgi:hypothetical protein